MWSIAFASRRSSSPPPTIPFVPVGPFRDPAVSGNPAVRVVVTPRGGHCGFVARRGDGSRDDGYWAERAVVDFAAEHASS